MMHCLHFARFAEPWGITRPMDKAEVLRMLAAMSDTEYRPASEIAKRCGLSLAAVTRHMQRLGQSSVEWTLKAPERKTNRVARTTRRVYAWRFKPGIIEKVRAS